MRIVETPYVLEYPGGESLGATVRWLRHEKGWTQQELAERAGYSRSVISGIERDLRSARARTIMEVLRALDPALHLAVWREEYAD